VVTDALDHSSQPLRLCARAAGAADGKQADVACSCHPLRVLRMTRPMLLTQRQLAWVPTRALIGGCSCHIRTFGRKALGEADLPQRMRPLASARQRRSTLCTGCDRARGRASAKSPRRKTAETQQTDRGIDDLTQLSVWHTCTYALKPNIMVVCGPGLHTRLPYGCSVRHYAHTNTLVLRTWPSCQL